MRKFNIAIIVFIFVLLSITQSFSSPQREIRDFKGMVGNIKIYLNGQQIQTRVEPFILQKEGLTMVPLRDLSQALGFAVEWDQLTEQINITGASPSPIIKPSQPTEVNRKVRIEDLTILRNIGPFYQKKSGNFVIANRHFGAGIAVQLSGNVAEVVMDLNQKYITLEGYYGVDDATMNSVGSFRLTIIGDQRELFVSEQVKPSEYPRYINPGSVDLSKVNRLTVRVEWQEAGLGNYAEIIAVLANVNFYQK